jgi:DNA-binding response OmpR family regulator
MARIMVVDDDSSVRRMLSQYLKLEGYDVLEAESGEQALSYARDSASDLILLDIEMPGIDGLETLRRLRREAPAAVVVMVSGINDEQRAVRSLEEGARDYIRKPFELQHLREILQKQLALRS